MSEGTAPEVGAGSGPEGVREPADGSGRRDASEPGDQPAPVNRPVATDAPVPGSATTPTGTPEPTSVPGTEDSTLRDALAPFVPASGEPSVPENVHPAARALARELRLLFTSLNTTVTAYGVRRHLHKATVSRYLNGVKTAPVRFVEDLIVDYVQATNVSPTDEAREHIMQLQAAAMRATNPRGWQIQELRAKWEEADRRRDLAEGQAEHLQGELDAAREQVARSKVAQDLLQREATRLAVAREELLRRVAALESDRRAAERRAVDFERQCHELAKQLETAEEAEERAVAEREAAAGSARAEAERLLRQARRELAASRSHQASGAGPLPGEPRRRHVLFAGPDAPWGAWIADRLTEAGAPVSAELLTPAPGETVVGVLEDRLCTADPVVVLSGPLRELGRYTGEEWSDAFRQLGADHPGRLTAVAPYGPALGPHDGVVTVDLTGADAAEADRLLRAATGLAEAPAPADPVDRLPTELPETWGLVQRRDGRFTGRDALLWTVHQELSQRGAPASSTAQAGVPGDDGSRPPAPSSAHPVVRTLVGMPGVGKTAVAAEYVHRFGGLYDVAWWVDAGSQDTVRSGLAQLAEELGAPRCDPGAELEALYTVLRSPRDGAGHRRMLLVLDGAEDPAVLAPMLPGRAVRVLVTSQNRAWERYGAELVDVPCFTWAESLACVARLDPGLGLRGDRTLARSVGDHPGALVQAVTEPCPGSDVRPRPLADALGRLHARVPQARLLLRLSDRFAEGAVPLRWLRALVTPHSESWEATAHELTEASLARIEADTLHVHPLVRRTALRGAHDAHLRETAVLAVDALTRADPQLPDTPGQWPRYTELVRHLEPSGVLGSGAPAARRLVRNCLAFCRWSGAHQRGLEIAARAEPDTELLVARTRLLREAGRFAEAARLLEADHGPRPTPGPGGHLAAGARAAALLGAGRYAEAEEQAHEAYRGRLRDSGPVAPGTIEARALLAECARALGDWDRALEIGAEVLSQYRKLTPWALPALFARSRHALDLRLLGRYSEAGDEQAAAVRAHEDVLGPGHPQTLAAQYELAMCHWHTGDPAGAAARLDHLRRAALRLPEGSPLTFHVLAVYSWVARRTTGGDPADISGRQALDGYRNMLPASHPYVLGLDANAALAEAGPHPERARPVLEGRWRELSNALGSTHPWALGLAVGLSGSRCADGDAQGAAELSGAAMAHAGTALGGRHPLTLLLTAAHSADLRALGRAERAAELGGTALEGLRRHHAEHPQTSAVAGGERPSWEFEPLPLHGLP